MHDFISRSKLQHRSESNSAAIFQLNSFPGEIFFSFRLGFFGGKLGKKEDNLIRDGAYYRPLVIERKGPVHIFGNHTFILEQAQYVLLNILTCI